MVSVFEFNDYKQFIQRKIDESDGLRGNRKKIAQAAGCHPSFLSRVISSHIHFTSDHIVELADFWGLDDSETQYFLTLVELARASRAKLKNRLEAKLTQMKQSYLNFSKLLKKKDLNTDDSLLYYSNWPYTVIHIAVAIAELQTESSLAKRFKLPIDVVSSLLKELEQMQLIKFENGRWQITSKHIHVPKSSPMAFVNHMNCRNLAIQKSICGDPENLNFSGVYALSKEEINLIQAKLRNLIQEIQSAVARSTPEDLVIFNCDFFRP